MTDQPSEPITIRRRTHAEQLSIIGTRLRDTHHDLTRALESLGVAAPAHLVVMLASAVQLEVIAQELAPLPEPTEDEYDAAHREEREAGENLRAAALRYAAARHRLDTVLNTPEEQQ